MEPGTTKPAAGPDRAASGPSAKRAYKAPPVVAHKAFKRPAPPAGAIAEAPPPTVQPAVGEGAAGASATGVNAASKAADLLFPEAVTAAPVTARAANVSYTGRPSAPAVRLSPAPPLVFDEPPAWKQLLLAPFATLGRILFLCIVVLVVGSVLGILHFINSYAPEDNPKGIAVDVQGGRVVGLPPGLPLGPSTDVANPGAMRQDKRDRAMESLAVIGRAMEEFGRENTYLPADLSPSLAELARYGDMASALTQFEGGKLDSYQRSFSPRTSDYTAVLAAKTKGLAEAVTYTVTYHFQAPRSPN